MKFSGRRTLAFTKKALKQFRHDRRTLAFILIVPLIMISIFGLTFGGSVRNIQVIIVNLDEGVDTEYTFPFPAPHNISVSFNMGDQIVEELEREIENTKWYESPNNLSLTYMKDLDKAKEKVDNGEYYAVIYLPPNLSKGVADAFMNLGSTVPPKAYVYIDASNPQVNATVQVNVTQASITVLSDINNDLAEQGFPQINQAAFQPEIDYAFGEGVKSIDFFAPGIMAFAILMVTTMLTIILFVQEKRHGTLERILASSATEAEVVGGYAIAFSAVAILQCLVILIVAITFFQVSVQGNILLAFLVLILVAVGHQGFGILLSAGAKNELQAIQFVPLIIFPSIILCGLFWPIESIPSFLQPLSNLVPLTYGIRAMRSVFLKGWNALDICGDLVCLTVFAIFTLVAAVAFLKRRK
jgi:ABC-2 type transport system permease protein